MKVGHCQALILNRSSTVFSRGFFLSAFLIYKKTSLFLILNQTALKVFNLFMLKSVSGTSSICLFQGLYSYILKNTVQLKLHGL